MNKILFLSVQPYKKVGYVLLLLFIFILGIPLDSKATLSIIGSFRTPTEATKVYVKDTYAYVIDLEHGLYIIDISDPSLPFIESSFETLGFPGEFFISEHYAYVVDKLQKLHIIDISDPANPSLVSSMETIGKPQAVAINNSFAFVSNDSKGLEIVDISDQNNPFTVSSVNFDGKAQEIHIAGTYAYVAAWTKGLQVININDLYNPQLVSSLDIPGQAKGITLSGSYAYIASGSKGLHVVDISEPLNPVLVGSLDTSGQALDVYVKGKYAFVANFAKGFQIIDISIPTDPLPIALLNTPGQAQSVFVTPGLAFVAVGNEGIQIIDISMFTEPELLSIRINGPSELAEQSNEQYTCTALYDDNTRDDITESAVWSSGCLFGEISSNGELMTYEVSSDEFCTIEALYGKKTATYEVTIKNVPKPVALEIIGQDEVHEHTQVQYSSFVLYDNGSRFDVTSSVNWNEDCLSADIVDNGSFSIGEVSVDEICTISARFENITQSKTIVIKDTPTVISIEISGLQEVEELTSNQYTSVSHYSDGTTSDITNDSIWSENCQFASITDNGTLLANEVNFDEICTISVSYEDKADVLDIKITDGHNNGGVDIPLLALGFILEGYIEIMDTLENFSHEGWPRVTWSEYNTTYGEARPIWCDVDGDNKYELIVGLGQGGRGWIEIKDDADTQFKKLTWLQVDMDDYNEQNGETFPACGDLDGDGRDEIVVGLGSGGGGWVKIFDDALNGYIPLRGTPTTGGWVRFNWNDYNTSNGEVHPAVANVDGDISEELVLGTGQGGDGWLQIVDDAQNGFTHLRWIKLDWPEYNTDVGETRPAACDLNGDNRDEIAIGMGSYTDGGWVKIIDSANNFSYLNCTYGGWVRVPWSEYNTKNGETYPTCGDIDNDGKDELVLGLGDSSDGWFVVYDDCDSSISVSSWKKSNWIDYNNNIGVLMPALAR